MKEQIKMEGIVIKITDYKEACVIANVLTNTGIVPVIIRGAKKLSTTTHPLANILTRISFNCSNNSNLSTLTDGIIINNYTNLKENILKYQAALTIIEKINYLYEGIKDYNLLYNLVIKIFDLLIKYDYYFSITCLFEIKLTYLLGINPNLKTCYKCNKVSLNGYLSIKNGSIICDKCIDYNDSALSLSETNNIKIIYSSKIENLTIDFLKKVDYKTYSEIMDNYYKTHIDFYSKSKPIFYKILLMNEENKQ